MAVMPPRVDTTDELVVPTIPFSTSGALVPDEARRLATVLREVAEVYDTAANLADDRGVTVSELGYEPGCTIRRQKDGRVDTWLTVHVHGYQREESA